MSVIKKMRTKRVNKGNNLHSQHDILDGLAQVFKVKQSGEVFQFRMYVKDEGKHYRKSLKTRDLDTALERGREMGMKILTDVKRGAKVFGLTFEDAVDLYLEDRQKDVDGKLITQGRHYTMQNQLKWFLDIVGRNTKVSEHERNTIFNYRRKRNAINQITDVTMRNEQSTINHMMKFLYRKNISHFETYDFQKVVIRQDDVGKRDTFTMKEYDKLIKFMRTYTTNKGIEKKSDRSNSFSDDEFELLERQLIRDYVLISSNTCMRVGELRQLKWGDVKKIETAKDEKGKTQKLVHINVRAETSKVRNSRKIIVRGGEYFERLKDRQQYTGKDDFVFSSVNGTSQLSAQKFAKHWKELMNGIGISHEEWKTDRNLTWYSLRHFGITMRIMSGVNVVDLSKLAGTSIGHIENTYLKYREEQMKTSALKTFSINKQGLVEV